MSLAVRRTAKPVGEGTSGRLLYYNYGGLTSMASPQLPGIHDPWWWHCVVRPQYAWQGRCTPAKHITSFSTAGGQLVVRKLRGPYRAPWGLRPWECMKGGTWCAPPRVHARSVPSRYELNSPWLLLVAERRVLSCENTGAIYLAALRQPSCDSAKASLCSSIKLLYSVSTRRCS